MIAGADIKAARKARGLTLQQVADACDISTSYMCDLEHDRRKVSASSKVVTRLAETLGFSVEEMLVGLDAQTRRRIEHLEDDLTVCRQQIKQLLGLLGQADRAFAASLALDGQAFARHRTIYLDARPTPL